MSETVRQKKNQGHVGEERAHRPLRAELLEFSSRHWLEMEWGSAPEERRKAGQEGKQIVSAGYLLDSGDRKILWLRTARFAWRHGTPSRLVARKASGALPTGAGDCRRYRGAARRPLGADKLLRAF